MLDLMPRIARFLPRQDLGNLRLTCRALRRLHGLRRRVHHAEQPESTLPGGHTLSSADGRFLRSLPKLRKLTLREPQSLHRLGRLTWLQTLRVQSPGNRRYLDLSTLSCLTCLRQLQLNASKTATNFASTHVLSCLTRLTGLSLRWDLQDSVPCPDGLDQGLSELTGLRELVLQASFLETAASELLCISRLRGLTCLEISAAYLPLCASLPGLESLGLDFFEGSHSLQFLSSLAALTALELCEQDNDVKLLHRSTLCNLTGLQHLDLVDCSAEDGGFAFGCLQCPAITSLTLTRSQGEDSEWSFAGCTNLRQLEVMSDDLEGVSFLSGEHCPPQHFTILVVGEASQVVFDADLICSGRVHVQCVATIKENVGTMDRDWC